MFITDEKNTLLIEYFESMGFSSFQIDGYRVINRFTNVEAELDSLYNGVALRSISHEGIIELKGNDALDLVHRIGTNSVKDLPKEGVKKTIFTTEKGRIIGLTTIMNFDNYQLLVCDRITKQKVMSWIRKYVISDDVQVNDANLKYNLLELTGPQAESFATLICGNIVNEIQPNSFKIIHTENILFFLIKIPGERGKNKFWFLADFENSKRLINYMQENKGVFNFNLVGEEVYNIYRIEYGIPVAPNELSDEFNPLEAGLEEIIDFNKGCYIGQEVIARLQTYNKVQKKLVGLKLNEPIEFNNGNMVIEYNGEDIGKLTSFATSHRLKSPIALAYIRNSHSTHGTQISLKLSDNKIVKSEVQSLPFLK
ncbi:MAG: aminomethyl transferase family protein [bacterium]|nr:aminomethyl transferase family protein [bacterium]